jgi:hypothetical protein
MYRCSMQVRNVGGFGMSSIDADAFAFTRPEPPKKNIPRNSRLPEVKKQDETGCISPLF